MKTYNIMNVTINRRILLFLFAGILSITSWANGIKIGDLYYILNYSDKTAEVTYTYTGDKRYENSYTGSITIPSTVSYNGNTYFVKSIGGYAFAECNSLTSITIPGSVTTIGEFAFYGCI